MKHSNMKRPPFYRVIWLQLAVTCAVAAISYTVGKVHALSALLGGFISILPNYYFVRKTFAYSGARAMRHIVNAFYRGEFVKFGLTAILFVLAFTLVEPLEPLTMLIAFIAVQMTNWLVPWILER